MGEYKLIINSKNDYFGFLPIEKNIVFHGGMIEVVNNFHNLNNSIKNKLNIDNFIYLPTLVSEPVAINRNGFIKSNGKNNIPEIKKKDFIQRLPYSHKIWLEEKPETGSLREYDRALLMHLTGYIHGYRLQFYDWFFDGRIMMSSFHDIIISDNRISEFFSHSFKKWKKWNNEIQRKFINILHMLCRAESYLWVWEKFLIYYMITDALYLISKRLYLDKSTDRHERIKDMCSHYGLKYYEPEVEKIICLRNDLVCESLWDGTQPCTGGSQESYKAVESLKRICLRLIPAVLNYDIDYISTDWRPYGTYVFE
ncbi:MAG: hypothetical protein ACR2NW_06365 [Thermodesulfobacteriota bacterium]